MKKFVVAILMGAVGLVCTSMPGVAASMMDFGSPPSGQIPILYNDHHVYSRPDVLRASRVLAALVHNGTIMVPLRSMFEQMGATVSYDPASKGFTIQKSGASIQLTLGKNEAVINGESRPLDQGPIMYQGVALVPVRVISETMGAYVEWVPSQRVVVVRYAPATPVPAPVPTVAPTTPPTPAPLPPTHPFNVFLGGAVNFGRVYNEFAAGQNDHLFGGGLNSSGSNGLNGSFVANGGVLFNPWAVTFNFRQDRYDSTVNGTVTPPYTLCSGPGTGAPATFFTVLGPAPQAQCGVAPFTAQQNTIDARLEYKVVNPHIYIGAGYVWAGNNYGYPQLSGFGGGLEKLPDFDMVQTQPLSWFGSVFYYPIIQNTYPATMTSPATKLEYQLLKYNLGVSYNFGTSPVYIYAGFDGDRYTAKQNVPVDQSHSGPFAGLGVHF